jgi:hypothetical protein
MHSQQNIKIHEDFDQELPPITTHLKIASQDVRFGNV